MSDTQASAAVDAQHPWLGLVSFSEETLAFFYGREDEVAELARRVQRKLLTVLFGQSGLGKTSILRAGIVPRLRPQAYCPVYVRIDYGRDAPSPAEQIKQAIFRETEGSGTWSQTGVAVEGESLWEFLHHRDDTLRDANGRTLTPLLIFDQFEEIFTLAQSDDFGRQRAAQFIADLADLVENRPPKAVEARLDSDDSAIERFDFARSDYRILIALREDYLAHLEGLKGAMPSITQNRMRLARMTGAQALDAVIKPGGKLVSQEVAEAIVRFVAGGAELRNAEVEPSLLSLICRELNAARIAQGRSEISADLLAGSHATILAEFYERALADQPAGVHRFIEEELLTDSGFRENIAQERVAKAFAEAGAAPDALAKLVDRRLLRIEERLDIRRVELTHDVLCSVVRASRDLRHEREARDEAERQLAVQREREAASKRALVRARQIAAGCIVLAVVAAGAAAFGVFGMHRAQATRQMAEAARGESERLIVYLLDDFQRELEPVGRLDIVGELARRALAYYQGLPAELQTPTTERNRALAQVRYGAVLRNQGRTAEAQTALDEAIATLDKLRSGGDASEPTAVGLALGLVAQARVLDAMGRDERVLVPAQRAIEVLAPMATAAAPSATVRRTYGAALTQLGFIQLRQSQEAQAAKTLEAARNTLRSIDGLTTDADAMANYAITSAWQVDALVSLGRNTDARQVGEEGRHAATQVLERHPTHMLALRGRALTVSGMAILAEQELRHAERLALADAYTADWALVTRIDPSNVIAWNNRFVGDNTASSALWQMGRAREAVARLRQSLDGLAPRVGSSTMLAGQMVEGHMFLAYGLADTGDSAGAEIAWREREKYMPVARADLGPDSPALEQRKCLMGVRRGTLSLLQNQWAAARKQSEAALTCVDRLKSDSASAAHFVIDQRRQALTDAAKAAIAQGDNAAAEKHLRASVEAAKKHPQATLSEQQVSADELIWLAFTLARQGQSDEARGLIGPALAVQRSLQKRPDNDDLFQRQSLVMALVAAAAAEPAAGKALLNEAQAIYDRLPAEFRSLNSTSFVGQRLAEARR
jgi:hypothetical protein